MGYCGKCAAWRPALIMLRRQLVCPACAHEDVGYWRDIASAAERQLAAVRRVLCAIDGEALLTGGGHNEDVQLGRFQVADELRAALEEE